MRFIDHTPSLAFEFLRSTALMMVFALTMSAAHASAAMFQGLSNMGNGTTPGWPNQAYAISGDGSTAVGHGDVYRASGPWTAEAFRWTAASGMQPMGDLPGPQTYSFAYGTNADGSVIVGYGSSEQNSIPMREAFRWTNTGGMQGLGDLPGGWFDSTANAVSADGSTVVGWGVGSANDYEAFRWTSTTGMQGLGDLPGGAVSSAASGVSSDGSIVVGTNTTTAGQEAFRWTSSGGMVGLGLLRGDDTYSAGIDISADGSTIVGYSSKVVEFDGITYIEREEAFRWTSSGGMQGLGTLAPGTWSGPSAVDADGSVIVGNAYGDFNGDWEVEWKPFIWDANRGMRDLRQVMVNELALNLTGWTLRDVTGISGDGRTIVGNGTNPSGYAEGWIAVVPEPASLSLFVAGTFVLLRPHRRR